MATVAEILNGSKHFGEFTGKIVGLGNPRQVNSRGSVQTVIDLTLNDGTGNIPWTCWEPTVQFQIGQMVTLSKSWVKEYQGKKSIALTKDGVYTVGKSVPAPTIMNAPQPATNLYDAPPSISTSTTQAQPTNFEIDDGLLDEDDICTVIKETQEMPDDVLEMLIKKNSYNGTLERREALIVIAKQLNVDITKPPYNPLDDMRKKPLTEMSKEELLEEFQKETNPAARGLIEKVLMHNEYIAVHHRANELKKLELKLMADINKINQEYEEKRNQMLKETSVKKTSSKKKSTKKKSEE